MFPSVLVLAFVLSTLTLAFLSVFVFVVGDNHEFGMS